MIFCTIYLFYSYKKYLINRFPPNQKNTFYETSSLTLIPKWLRFCLLFLLLLASEYCLSFAFAQKLVALCDIAILTFKG